LLVWKETMRKLILFSALALASCGGSQQANNAAVSEESGAGDVTAVNDTTAIDAATGQAANMAADVNYTFNEDLNADTENTSATKPTTKAPAKKKSEPAFEPEEPAMTNNSAG
jgi:hypothetical protein